MAIIQTGFWPPNYNTIAFDAATDSGTSFFSPYSFNHTVGASLTNGILFVGISVGSSTDQVSTVKYNNVSMTRACALTGSGTRSSYLYYLANPTAGTNAVAFTGTWTSLNATAVSYSGALQYTIPDNNTTQYTAGPSTTDSDAITVVANNSWAIAAVNCPGGAISAGANTTKRGTANTFCILDSNAAKAPGSFTLNVSNTGATTYYWATATFAPGLS